MITKRTIKTIATTTALAAIAAVPLVVLPANLAANATAPQYQVDVIKCPGLGANFSIGYPDLAGASQNEVDSVKYQQNNPGTRAQIRLVHIDQLAPIKLTTLISSSQAQCGSSNAAKTISAVTACQTPTQCALDTLITAGRPKCEGPKPPQIPLSIWTACIQRVKPVTTIPTARWARA